MIYILYFSSKKCMKMHVFKPLFFYVFNQLTALYVIYLQLADLKKKNHEFSSFVFFMLKILVKTLQQRSVNIFCIYEY